MAPDAAAGAQAAEAAGEAAAAPASFTRRDRRGSLPAEVGKSTVPRLAMVALQELKQVRERHPAPLAIPLCPHVLGAASMPEGAETVRLSLPQPSRRSIHIVRDGDSGNPVGSSPPSNALPAGTALTPLLQQQPSGGAEVSAALRRHRKASAPAVPAGVAQAMLQQLQLQGQGGGGMQSPTMSPTGGSMPRQSPGHHVGGRIAPMVRP